MEVKADKGSRSSNMFSEIITTTADAFSSHNIVNVAILILVVLTFAVGSLYRWYRTSKQYSHLPCVNDYPNDWSRRRAYMEFTNNAEALISEGMMKYPNQPFTLLSSSGPHIILPHSYIGWIKKHPDLSLHDAIRQSFFTKFPGFEGLGAFLEDPTHFLITMVRSKMTKLTPELLQTFKTQAKKHVQLNFGESADFHAMSSVDVSGKIVAPVTSAIFCGDQLASESSWLELITSYTRNMAEASLVLRTWPALLRPLVHWFLEKCRVCRVQVRQTRSMLTQVDVNDEKLQETVLAWSKESPKFDAATLQLGLSFAAIHTSTQLLSQCLLDIALAESLPAAYRRHPNLVSDLRKEISAALKNSDGLFEPSTIADLALLDACIKESQRFKPPTLGNIMRSCDTKTVILPDAHGTRVAKGTMVHIPTEVQWSISTSASQAIATQDGQKAETGARHDPAAEDDGWGPDAHIWNPYRFIDEARNARMKAVTVNERHFGFGIGRTACPGRFFAVAELKIVLAEIIMGWDIRIAPSSMPAPEPSAPTQSATKSIQNQEDNNNVLVSERTRQIWFECGRVPPQDVELDRFTDATVNIEAKRRLPVAV